MCLILDILNKENELFYGKARYLKLILDQIFEFYDVS